MNGKISQIMGAVVDVSFSKGELPKILNALEIEHNENKLILKLLLLMAFADKIYMEEEKELINKISSKLEVSKEELNELITEVEKTEDITKQCREIANQIQDKQDREKTIKLLSEMMTTDLNVHRREIFALQIIAEEWNMFIDQN